MDIYAIITNAVRDYLVAGGGSEPEKNIIQIQKTRKEFDGDLTLVVFPLLRITKKSPEQSAEDIGAYLVGHCSEIDAYNVIKGFLNLVISPVYWSLKLEEMTSDMEYGRIKPMPDSPLYMIEYSSPNTNKPLHLGHIRNNLVGNSISRIMQANGFRVSQVNLVNDRGIHICKSMLAWQKWGNGATPESAGKKGDHLVGDYYVMFDRALKEQVREMVAAGSKQENAEK
jgi:arginyl-tRNA synthetase